MDHQKGGASKEKAGQVGVGLSGNMVEDTKGKPDQVAKEGNEPRGGRYPFIGDPNDAPHLGNGSRYREASGEVTHAEREHRECHHRHYLVTVFAVMLCLLGADGKQARSPSRAEIPMLARQVL